MARLALLLLLLALPTAAMGMGATAAAFLAPATTPTTLQHKQQPTALSETRHAYVLLRQWATPEDDDDLTERSLSLLSKLARGLNRELPVPTLLVPPRPDEKGTSTTIKGWFPLSMGLSLTLGNPVYPAALVGFLYLSRPTDAPDVAAAAAAAVVAGVINPLVENFADATGLDDSIVGRLPFLLGAAATAYVLIQVLGEGKEVFVDAPRREERERMPAAKAERDLKFMDVKLREKAGSAGAEKQPPPKSTGGDGGAGGGEGSRWRE